MQLLNSQNQIRKITLVLFLFISKMDSKELLSALYYTKNEDCQKLFELLEDPNHGSILEMVENYRKCQYPYSKIKLID